jgi:thiosulfate/3-mercaptopyruvate sulfurtransferase
MSGYPDGRWLVETDWLAANLEDPELRVLDCTMEIAPVGDGRFRFESGEPRYREGHIPGAAYVDMGQWSDRDSPLLLMLPPPHEFAEHASALGIGEGVRVVAYSAGNMWWATRLWWMFRAYGFDRVAVLNGGYQKWLSEGCPSDTEVPEFARAGFAPRLRPELVADKESVLAAMGADHTVTINALSPKHHSGESDLGYGRPGRISGSVNVSAMALLDPDSNTFRSADELMAAFAGAMGEGDRRAICYCGGGIAATMDAFALALLGRDEIAVYDASLGEWAADPRLPMSVGED